MLRMLVLLLLLANAGFWAWRQGWLEPLHGVIGARPEGEREPERLALQVSPELVRLQPARGASAPARPASAASAAEPAASAASEPAAPPALACLEAGPFDAAGLTAAQAVLQVLLPADAARVRRLATGSWWVAMGPYVEAAPLRQKREELRKLDFSPATARLAADGAPYLVLQRHDSREAAEAALKALAERGVRSGRIVDGGVAAPRALRVAQADADQQVLLAALPEDKLGGRRFEPCPPDAP
ncbi:MAG TPA: SPOR domain-containing protein [Methylibium sp.]|nr:SPOR domain-containing protein [Methylibium sp.]